MKELFEQTTLGKISTKNHFVRSATYEGKATEDGYPTDTVENLYLKLADGGIGTIITSYTYITDYEQPQKNQLGIYKDELIPAYQELVNKVHDHGAKIVMQIVHGSSWGQGYPEKAKILGPSAITFPRSGLTPKEMTVEEIKAVIQYFADAAVRVKKAGFDGVQLHIAHSYLLAQFISPLYNHRTDEYGGSTENRFRIVKEVYEAVRKAVGTDYPVWAKINSSDEEEGGLTVEEFLEDAKKLADLGIDAIEVSGELWTIHKPTERAYYKDPAARLQKEVSMPVILTGGLRNLSDIKEIIDSTNLKFFGFARPLLQNPNLIKDFKKEI